MQRMYSENNTDTAYVILKVDNAVVLRHARITHIIENPMRYIVEGEMTLSSDAMMIASWD